MPFYKVRAPSLPQPTDIYDRQRSSIFNDALRLYFNRLDGDLTALSDTLGAAQLNVPTALYYDTTSQTAAVINTAYKLKFGNTYFQNGITISGTGGTTFTVDRPGIYNFQFSGQLWSNSASQKEAQVWIRKNGTDIGYSGRAYTIDMNTGHLDAVWNFNIDLAAGGYIELMWATNNTDLYFDPEAASSPYPGIPSAVVAVNFISNTEGFAIATTPTP
jgi:hypothetical protein